MMIKKRARETVKDFRGKEKLKKTKEMRRQKKIAKRSLLIYSSKIRKEAKLST